ncbi:uncharacterized protein LOC132703355 [Cylas formicarius]|uniref:uncharacterized protein LOC132703355 n=1 Tax=Cylas formicarius TaxID=197179 RepID=UPI002958775E|nr:uncharacterized protein LOC132703355 [Cylas formicarius]
MKKSPAQLLYGPLLSGHVKTILESGLLLDEDYEVLLKSFNFETFSVEPYKPPMGLIVCGATTAASIVLAKRIKLTLLPIAPLAATAAYLYLEIRSICRRNEQRAAVKRLINSFIKLHKLINGIIAYQKTRNEIATKKTKIFYGKNVEKFSAHFAERFMDLLYYLLSELQFLSSFSESLCEDFQELRELDISRLLDTDNLVNESLPLSMKVKDLYCLLMSKFLNYLGVNLCKNLVDICTKEVDCLLSSTLPKLTTMLVETYSAINIEFKSLRCSINEKLSFKTRTPFKKHISGKLQQTLAGSLNKLSIIFEQARMVLEKVDNLNDEENLSMLQDAIAELRDHALATYESLDILCKLYGILSKSESNATNRVEITKENSDPTANVPWFNFDDETVALEENYELYVGKDDINHEEELGICDDKPGAYLGLMLRELGQCLKQHERFVAARNKRGIKDGEEEQLQYQKIEKPTPKFDLMVVPAVNSDNQIIVPPTLLPPPPPPVAPPLPLNVVHEYNDGASGSTHSLLTSLKSLTRQLQTKEEVFGDRGVENSSSDSD